MHPHLVPKTVCFVVFGLTSSHESFFSLVRIPPRLPTGRTCTRSLTRKCRFVYKKKYFCKYGNSTNYSKKEYFDNFFEDCFVEAEDKYGDVEEMNVCDNLGDHLVSRHFPIKLICFFKKNIQYLGWQCVHQVPPRGGCLQCRAGPQQPMVRRPPGLRGAQPSHGLQGGLLP